jgi:hypothetical protein
MQVVGHNITFKKSDIHDDQFAPARTDCVIIQLFVISKRSEKSCFNKYNALRFLTYVRNA